ncbi:SRPBCC family protein [Arthrobacter sp. ov407]|uniref:SRPBCC family protein n=1 Tax=Arthrobacter sp. ov407 TaxID=1761748 RepID=UPI000B82ED07|nr:SRPBCC family protein [Arthrobacter sp. ov407]
MSTHQRTHRTTHRLGINAPADLVFSMLRDASHWPYLDGLTVYSERVSGDDAGHELRTSVVSNGSLSSSHCWRVFDAASHRAEFHQLDLEPPLRELGGGWEIRPADGLSVATLTHEFELDDEHLAERINAIIEDYSRRELEALRVSCERLSVLLQHHAPQTLPTPHPTPHPTSQSTAKEA